MDTRVDRKTAEATVEEILSAVAGPIGSILSPDYHRIKLNSKRYSSIVKDLSANFWVRDISDENEDVCSALVLRFIGEPTEDYVIYISNIANYAFVMKISDCSSCEDSRMHLINDLFRKFGLESLSRDVLSFPIETSTFYADNPRLFNLLFSDTDFLPWEKPDCG
jgi:hypothetical protein